MIKEFDDKKIIFFCSNIKLSTNELRDQYNIRNRGVDKQNK